MEETKARIPSSVISRDRRSESAAHHRQKAAAQAFLEDLVAYLLRQRILRLAIGHQLDAEEEPFAAHVAHPAQPIGPGAELVEHRLADLAHVVEDVFLVQDAEAGEGGR